MKAFVIDLLCVSPIYDRYLCEAVREEGIDARLSSITFHLDTELLRSPKIVRTGWILDVVAKLRLSSVAVRRGLKVVEYLTNLVLQLAYIAFQRPHLIHVQWLPLLEYGRLDLYWLRLLKATGSALVMTVHNVLPHDSEVGCAENFKAAYRLFDHLIVHTSLAKRSLVEDFGIDATKIAVIPHGPMLHDHPRPDRAAARAALQIDPDADVVVFVGTCKPYKGVEFLLRSWEAVARSNPRAVLLVAGNGDAEYLEKIRALAAAAPFKEAVRLDLRGLSNDEIITYHVAADVLALPYANITQSGALLTGMAFGKTIVATDIAGFRETLENEATALLVPPCDEHALSGALLRVLADRELRDRLGRQVLREVGEKYNWKSIARATVGCYGQVLAARRG